MNAAVELIGVSKKYNIYEQPTDRLKELITRNRIPFHREFWALRDIEESFVQRILPIDSAVARVWGELAAARSLPVIDTLIAATAKVHNLMLVTRNSYDFKSTNVSIINPRRSAEYE